jgi:predicted outer membrane repeat protein
MRLVCLLTVLTFLGGCGESSDAAGNAGSGGNRGYTGAGGVGGGIGVCVDNVCLCTEAGIRAAIAVGGGPFTFDWGGPTTVVTEAEILIDNDVILDGAGSLTVDGNEVHRVFSVREDVTAELRGLTVTKGRTDPEGDWRGSGILNDGALILTKSIVSDSVAPGDGSVGGGIHNSRLGRLTVTHCNVSGNTAAHGGGIDNSGVLAMTGSTVSSNTAERSGGGIYNEGTLTLANSTVSGNTAALANAGIFNVGTLTVVASTLSGVTADDGGSLVEGQHLQPRHDYADQQRRGRRL